MAKAQKEAEPVVNAVLEGAEAVEEGIESVRIPIALDAVFERLDKALRQRGAALIAIQQPRANVLDVAKYSVFEAEIKDGGKVRVVDLVKRAYELNCLDPHETVVSHFMIPPIWS
jgi:hypothetical protein